MIRYILTLALLVVMGGCHRTQYVNVRPQQVPLEATAQESSMSSLTRVGGWQSFFLWGLAPGAKKIDASAACKTPENIGMITTRRSFLEGLVAALSGFYINIYSPWDGAVYCKKG
jgi:hypothetical protein